jgi:hypothetical protein
LKTLDVYHLIAFYWLHVWPLIVVWLQLGTVHLCRSVIRSIETARVFDFEEFPTRDKVNSLSCRNNPLYLYFGTSLTQ